MMNIISRYEILITPGIIFIAVFILGLILRRVILSYVTQLVRGTKSQIDDIILAAIRKPSILWCVIAGLYLAVHYSAIKPQYSILVQKAIIILGIASITLALADALTKLIKLSH